MVQITQNVPDEDFWMCVLGSGWETWSWWIGWTFEPGSSWDTAGAILVDAIDPDSGEILVTDHLVTLGDMAAAFSHLVSNGYRFDAEDLDASDADCVLQYAVFGEVIYG